MDYESFDYSIVADPVSTGLSASIILLYLCAALPFLIFAMVCAWKIFDKMGEPGWVALIPLYNTWVFYKHIWGNGLFMLISIIPVVGAIFTIITTWKMYTGFDKSTGFKIFGLFFAPIAAAVCAFDQSSFSDPISF